MFTERTFNNKIHINPQHLSKNWSEHFFNTLQKTFGKTVSKDNGAILKVVKLTKVQPPEVINGNIEAMCTYTAFACKPSVGDICNGIITIVRPQGILIESNELVRVLIQPNNIPSGYSFDPVKKVFQNGIHSYAVGDKVKFKILNIKYLPNQINCIGSIKDIIVETEKDIIDETGDDFVD